MKDKVDRPAQPEEMERYLDSLAFLPLTHQKLGVKREEEIKASLDKLSVNDLEREIGRFGAYVRRQTLQNQEEADRLALDGKFSGIKEAAYAHDFARSERERREQKANESGAQMRFRKLQEQRGKPALRYSLPVE